MRLASREHTGCDSSHLVLMCMMACTILSQSLCMNDKGPLSFDMVSVNWLSSTKQTYKFKYILHCFDYRPIKLALQISYQTWILLCQEKKHFGKSLCTYLLYLRSIVNVIQENWVTEYFTLLSRCYLNGIWTNLIHIKLAFQFPKFKKLFLFKLRNTQHQYYWP